MRVSSLPILPLDLTQPAALRKLTRVLARLPDPRRRRQPLHLVTDIVAITLCAVVANCDSWEDVEQFADTRQAWLRTFLRLPHGVPSRSTYSRVLEAIDPQAFQNILLEFVQSLQQPDADDPGAHDQHVAIDGKTLRSSFDRAAAGSPLHLVQAMDTGSQLVLAHVSTTVTSDETVKKTNEIGAIKPLLDVLDLTGATVTIDAIGCQTEIAAKIVDGGGDYLLALKDNHPTMARQAGEFFLDLHSRPLPRTVRTLTTTDRAGRGRREARTYVVAPIPAALVGVEKWKGLRSFVQTTTVIESAGKATVDVRYYLSSLTPRDAAKAARCLRRHWRIESAHWTLDVTFGEDRSRVASGPAAENLATLRRVALCLIKTYQTTLTAAGRKRPPSLKALRKLAAMSTDVLAKTVLQRS